MVSDALLVGTETLDDAAVYQISNELVLVVTMDVFTPIVDDPFTFGAIAAANALSDIYAMGANPILALNFAAFPRDTLPLEVLGEIQRGGAEVVLEAGALIAGGHSIDDPEPKYGLAVVGTAHPDAIITNAGARPNDLLVLTKPIGTGIISTAIKHDAAPENAVQAAITSMRALNRKAAEVAAKHGVHAMTDVSGYGLLGHLREMLAASQASALVQADEVPYLPLVANLIKDNYVPGGTERNLAALEGDVIWDNTIAYPERIAMCDAQTSGGLLIAVPPENEPALRLGLTNAGALAAATIGRVLPPHDTILRVVRSHDRSA